MKTNLFIATADQLRQSFAQRLMKNDQYKDVWFEVDGESIGAHRAYMAAVSEVFERMLMGDFREAEQTEIPIQEANAKLFKLLIDFYYSFDIDFASLNDEELVEMMKLSDRFQTSELSEMIQRYFLQDYQLDCDNYVFWYINFNEIGEIYFIDQMKLKVFEVMKKEVIEKTASGVDQAVREQLYAKLCQLGIELLFIIDANGLLNIYTDNFRQYLMRENKDLLIGLFLHEAFDFSRLSPNFVLYELKRFVDGLEVCPENQELKQHLIDKSYEALRLAFLEMGNCKRKLQNRVSRLTLQLANVEENDSASSSGGAVASVASGRPRTNNRQNPVAVPAGLVEEETPTLECACEGDFWDSFSEFEVDMSNALMLAEQYLRYQQ